MGLKGQCCLYRSEDLCFSPFFFLAVYFFNKLGVVRILAFLTNKPNIADMSLLSRNDP